jgi:hypothetical protein
MSRPSSSSAAAASPSRRYEFPPPQSDNDWESTNYGSSSPPSLTQLAALKAVPAGMVGGKSTSGRRKKGSRSKLAKEGQAISRTFDTFGTRPYPTNGISLEPQIQVEMQLTEPLAVTTSATNGVYSYFAQPVTLSIFSGTSALISVFDQYRIDQLEFWFDALNPNVVTNTPMLYTCVDLDDASVPTSIGQIQDHPGALLSTGPSGHYHRFKPHMAIAAYSGAFTSYSNVPATWIDSASPNVQHFGIKMATLSTGNIYTYNLIVRAIISFRAPVIN